DPRPDAKASARDEPQDAEQRVARVKAVHAQVSEEERKQQRRHPRLLRSARSHRAGHATHHRTACVRLHRAAHAGIHRLAHRVVALRPVVLSWRWGTVRSATRRWPAKTATGGYAHAWAHPARTHTAIHWGRRVEAITAR